MVKFICSFAERVLTGVAAFLLIFALVVGMAQNALADPPINPPVPPVNCNKSPGPCASCATSGGMHLLQWIVRCVPSLLVRL